MAATAAGLFFKEALMDKKMRANLILLQVKAIQDGRFEKRTGDLLTLVNEVIRDAEALAEETLESDSDDPTKKDAA